MVKPPTPTSSVTDDPYIIAERWYHRLIQIVVVFLTAALLILSLLVSIPTAFFFDYSYSFTKNYKNFAGSEYPCVADEKILSFECGDLSVTDFISRYLEQKGHYFTSSGPQISTMVNQLKNEGLADLAIAKAIIEQNGVWYKEKKNLDKNQLLKAILTSCGLAAAFYLLNTLLYKTILYVVHGHTNVVRQVKPPPPSHPSSPLPPI